MNAKIAEFYEDRLGRELTEDEHDALRQLHEALGAERCRGGGEPQGSKQPACLPERAPGPAGMN